MKKNTIYYILLYIRDISLYILYAMLKEIIYFQVNFIKF